MTEPELFAGIAVSDFERAVAWDPDGNEIGFGGAPLDGDAG